MYHQQIELLNRFAEHAIIGLIGKAGKSDTEVVERAFEIAKRMLDESERIERIEEKLNA